MAAYLFYKVAPLFYAADVEQVASYATQQSQLPLYLSLEEYKTVGFSLFDSGNVLFFDANTGATLLETNLFLDKGDPTVNQSFPISNAAKIDIVASSGTSGELMAIGVQGGKVLIAQHSYESTYPDGKRKVIPSLRFPYGKAFFVLTEQQVNLEALAIGGNEQGFLVMGYAPASKKLHLLQQQQEESFSGEMHTQTSQFALPWNHGSIQHMLLDSAQKKAFIVTENGILFVYRIEDNALVFVEKQRVVSDGVDVSAFSFLNGENSILIGDSSGQVQQRFAVKDDTGFASFSKIRTFQHSNFAIKQILPEQRRRGFVVLDAEGNIGVYYSTSERLMHFEPAGSRVEGVPSMVALAAKADAMLSAQTVPHQEAPMVTHWKIDNPHPEISWKVLWGKVWYEGQQSPNYTWQSTGGSDEFESKLSLVPLTLGTIKATFYTLLFSIPLAIGCAIYTACFMNPCIRRWIKPAVEMMAALPSVVLGFVAAIWLAPLLEDHLTAFLLSIPIVLIGVFLLSLVWLSLPKKQFSFLRFPDEPFIYLIPVVIALVAFSAVLGGHVENVFFAGDLPQWLNNQLQWSFTQRNALVVGIAMGFAVVPIIFSISEDAIRGVPLHLTAGSLALGATLWQTLTRVVILAASPGIFSAIMIGMGRAVGETMIVVMATGNTPITGFNLFQGFRALSANIATEMPEAEPASTHFRILFLSGLVLFLFTFFFNILAESLSKRLRKRYSAS